MAVTLESGNLLHPDYADNIKKWEVIRVILEGKEAITAAGEEYLPRPSGRSDDEYAAYQKRAVLYNATARTLDGLLGAIFRKQAKVVIPPSMQYLIKDADGEGNGLLQFSKNCTETTISYGRLGILTDYPQATGIKTLADEREANLKARIQVYSPQAIVNWRVVRRGGRLVLTNLLLQEYGSTSARHAFLEKKFLRYRLLELDENGYYVIRILEDTEVEVDGVWKTIWTEVDTIEPLLPNGKRLEFIPFKFVGSVTNSSQVNKAPLYDMAELNLAHFRNSADQEESLYMIGQPTPWITGLDEDFIEKNQGNLKIGSRTCWLLPTDCNVGLLESKAEKSALQKALEDKVSLMIGLGARLVQDNSVRGSESSESVMLRRSGEASQMSCIADNVSEGIEQCIKWAAMWQDESPDSITFALNKDFFTNRLSHNDIRELVSAWQSGAISHDVLLDNFRKGEVLDELTSNEEVRDQIDDEPVLGVEMPVALGE